MPGARFRARERKAIRLPSALIAGGQAAELLLVPCSPNEEMLTSVVSPVSRSWTKMSVASFSSPSTRLLASDANATYRPSPLIAG
jgi:hypothetical protein